MLYHHSHQHRKRDAFRYTGQYFDTESGTYYLRARYYNPATGRFTQQDAWANANRGDPLGLNLYCYCFGNPVRYFDPSGRTAKDVVAGVVFALDDNVLDSTSRWLLSTVLGISDRYSWDDASDYYLGRVIGDVISMAIGIGSSVAGIIDIIKAILEGAAITVSTGGVGAVVGVSVAVGEIAVGVALVAEGETATEAALHSLLDDYGKYSSANTSIPSEYQQLFENKREHIFSDKHKNKGIMQLGDSEEDIFMQIIRVINKNSAQWAEGSNEIRTVINGTETTIRFFIKNGNLINVDAYVGYSGRALGNLIP